MTRVEWDFTKRPRGAALDEACAATQAVLDEAVETRRKMAEALDRLGYKSPLPSERREAYLQASIHKRDAERHDWIVAKEHFEKHREQQ